MNRSFLNYLLFLTTLLPLVSCQQTKKVKSKNYAFELKSGGLSTRFEAFLNNTNDASIYSRERFKIENRFLDNNTLYVLKSHFKDTIRIVDTLKVKLEESAVDSLYDLTYDYLSTVNMDNEIEVEDNRVRNVVVDGASFTVSLIFNDKRLEASQWRLKGVSHASQQAEKLFTFINSKLPEEFMLY